MARLYRILMLVAVGGTLFQTTGSCKNQLVDTMLTSVVPTLTSALATALASAVTSSTSS